MALLLLRKSPWPCTGEMGVSPGELGIEQTLRPIDLLFLVGRWKGAPGDNSTFLQAYSEKTSNVPQEWLSIRQLVCSLQRLTLLFLQF
ncbi:hypothetical protein ABKS89_28595 [Pseudomonas sp. LABIM340]|uniref:hypothetical protein n=1 Tax=Pseudomonas sp. LABIM340 TaxID=3156585 RepID=UPI0032AFE9A9